MPNYVNKKCIPKDIWDRILRFYDNEIWFYRSHDRLKGVSPIVWLNIGNDSEIIRQISLYDTNQ